jgi:hypothetical protein
MRLAAARARARGTVAGDEIAALAALEPSLWRIANAGGRPIWTLDEDLQLHGADLAGLPASRLSATVAKTLLAVLVVTAAAGARHPYPGRLAMVDDVFEMFGGPRLGRQAEAHIKGALKKLHGWQVVRLGEDLCGGYAHAGVELQVGPMIALWSGPWVTELVSLIARVAEHRQVNR